jgi:hypothetical protein
MEIKWKIAALVAGLAGTVCLTVLLAPQLSLSAGMEDAAGSHLHLPVFPGASLETKLPAQGEARYLTFRSYADPEQIHRYFTDSANLDGWEFTGQIAGSSGVVLQDRNGRRLIIDVRAMSSCLLQCRQQIYYWLTAK